MPEREKWLQTQDGFAVCTTPLADILEGMGIFHTGLSSINKADVQSYYDDWHLYSVTGEKTVYSLLKMREQEHDYVPGFADKDNPGVTISFIPFNIAYLRKLEDCEDRQEALAEFVAEFRRVTEYGGQRHSEVLQRYFSNESARASYLVAELYLKKLLTAAADGNLPLPERMTKAPSRVLERIRELNAKAGRTICDLENGQLVIADPANPTPEEQCCVLVTHTGNPDFNSFAAEVKYHADALISLQNRIPIVGKTEWYDSAIRADMQIEPDDWIRIRFFAPYYDKNSSLVRQQAMIHGEK